MANGRQVVVGMGADGEGGNWKAGFFSLIVLMGTLSFSILTEHTMKLETIFFRCFSSFNFHGFSFFFFLICKF